MVKISIKLIADRTYKNQ